MLLRELERRQGGNSKIDIPMEGLTELRVPSLRATVNPAAQPVEAAATKNGLHLME